MVSSELLREFSRLGEQVKGAGGLFGQRVARIYDASSRVPTIFLIKPDQKRFWTRSMGLQDADDVAVDLFRWQHESVFLGGEVLN